MYARLTWLRVNVLIITSSVPKNSGRLRESIIVNTLKSKICFLKNSCARAKRFFFLAITSQSALTRNYLRESSTEQKFMNPRESSVRCVQKYKTQSTLKH